MKQIFKIGIVLFVALLVLPSAVGAQSQDETWSLEKCVDYARDNSLEVQQRLIGVYYAELQVVQAKWDKAGSASGTISESLNLGRTLNSQNDYINSNSWSTNIGANYNVLLFNNFRLQNLQKVQELTLQSSEQELEALKEDISLQVVMAYLDVIYSKEMVKSVKSQLEVSKGEREKVQAKYDAGEASKEQLLENASQLAREESNLTDAMAQETINVLKLRQLLNISEDASFEIIEPMTEEIKAELSLASATDLYAYAVKNRPSIKATEYSIKSDEAQLEATKAGLMPSLGAGYSINTGYNNKNKFISNDVPPVWESKNLPGQFGVNLRQSLGIQLSVPIFNGYRARNNVKAAELQIDTREMDLRIAKRNLKATLQRVYNDAFTANKKFEASQKVTEASKASFEFAQQKYALGAMSVFDYNVSKNNLAKAEIELIQAKYQFIFASKVLDYYRGIPLKL